MMLTLFADASYCPKTGAAGWGSWAIRDGWPKGIFLGGPLRREISCSNTAELCGIASALWMHEKRGELEEVKAFMLQCDNTAALGIILGRAKNAFVKQAKGRRHVHIGVGRPASTIQREAVDEIVRIVGSHGLFLRHVKGHNGTDDGRSWVNTQCDAAARRHMEARRRELNKAA